MRDVEAPINFFVTSFSPLQIPVSRRQEIEICGVGLDNVRSAFINDFVCSIEEQTAERMKVIIDENILEQSTGFFIILEGDQNAWYPVGPMIAI